MKIFVNFGFMSYLFYFVCVINYEETGHNWFVLVFCFLMWLLVILGISY